MSQVERRGGEVVRRGYLALGLIFVGLGFVGIAVPVMPTTIFMILGLWAFKKSSPRLENWLRYHPLFGATLRDWEEHGAIRKETKVVAIALVWVGIATSIVFVHSIWVRFLLLCVAASLTWYIASRPTR